MYRNGHYGVALLVFAPIGVALVSAGLAELAVLIGAGTLWLAMLPDVDHRVPGISHRGPTHTIWFTLAVASVLGGVGLLVGRAGVGGPLGAGTLAAVGVATGLTSIGAHLLADALTPMGIRPFWPLSSRTFTLSVVTADSTVGNYGLLGAGLFTTAAWTAALLVP